MALVRYGHIHLWSIPLGLCRDHLNEGLGTQSAHRIILPVIPIQVIDLVYLFVVFLVDTIDTLVFLELKAKLLLVFLDLETLHSIHVIGAAVAVVFHTANVRTSFFLLDDIRLLEEAKKD